MLPGKTSKENAGRPYRNPTQVGEEKILRRSGDLSLRNSANLPRNFGIRGASVPARKGREEVAVKRARRLFNKNTGLCEVERQRIGTDSCPVPEG